MATRIQVRRGTTSQWNTANPTLEEGEIGYNTTLGQMKIGDGTSVWADLDYIVNSASLDTSLGSYIPDTEKSAINGVAELDGSKNILAPAGIVFEGTANDHETTLAVTDPTADRTITLPNVSGTVITTGNLSDITNIGVFTSTIVMEGSTANDFELTLSAGDPTADRTITFPDATGTVALTTDIAAGTVTETGTQTLTNKSISLGSNTVTSTLAQLNTAISDADVATLAGTETLTNKTLTSPKINEDVAVTATATELNYVDGVTSAIQTQMDAKAPLASPALTGTATAVNLTISGDLTVNGTTTNINSTNLVVEDKNIVLGDAATPTDTTADGGGITLKGATDKTFNWVDATDAWTSSEHINIASGKTLKYNGTDLVASQTGNSGKFLTTDGTSSSWATVSGYSAPTLGSTSIASGATVSDIVGLTINSTTIPTSATLLTSGGALGTPSSGTLTNATGLPISGLTASTSAALGLGTIELGHATDTTIARGSAGVVTIEGVNIVTTSSTDTLTNKTLSSAIATTALTLNATAELRLADTDSTHYVGFKSPATVSTNRIWTLPSADGTSGQTLSTNGSGTLSFSTPAAGAAFSEFMLIGC